MSEIKEALSILKARWVETALMIGLVAVPMPLMRLLFEVYPIEANRMILANNGILLLQIGISLFVLLIGGGFLRTVYLEGQKRQSISSLMKTGRHFFSRIFGFSILYAGAMMLPIMVLYLIIQARESGENLASTLTFAIRIVQPMIKLILVKPILLVPAVIIVTDCELSESFGFIRRMRLLDAKGMLTVFVIQIFLPLFFPYFRVESLWHYPRVMLYSILTYGLMLAVMIMAVRFAGSVSREN